MAVDAHHFHLHNTHKDSQQSIYDPQMAFVDAPLAVFSSESGLTAANDLPRKRPRINFYDVSTAHIHQQMVLNDVRLADHQAGNAGAEIMDRRSFAKQVVTMVEERASKRMRAKEEEIERISKLNWALEEKLKSLIAENQVWRYLAQTNEAAAVALRTNLELVLTEQIRAAEQSSRPADPAAADDAESCCGGDNFEDDVGNDLAATTVGYSRNLCRSCDVYEPSVMLMPCHHLCMCAGCASGANVCPICDCCLTGSVHVNLSS